MSASRSAAAAAVLLLAVTSSLAAQKSPPPTNVSVVGAGTSATVSWTPVAVRGVTYRVLRGLDAGKPGTDLTPPIASASLVDPRVTPGTTYFYQVIAVYGNGISAPAAPVAFTAARAAIKPSLPVASPSTRVALPAGKEALATAPASATVPTAAAATTTPLVTRTDVAIAPGQLRSGAVRVGPAPASISTTPAPTSVALTWPSLAGVVAYSVERSVGAVAGPWTASATVSTASYTDVALDPDTPVQYRVTASYYDGRAGVSAPVATRTTKPSNPANLRASVAPHVITAQITPTFQASSVAYGDIALAWDNVAGASYYEVSGTGLSMARQTPTPAFAVPQVPPGTATYQVIAWFKNGVRQFGDATRPTRVEVLVGSPPVTGFGGVTYAGSSAASVDFRWANSNGATGFKLFRGDAEFGPFAEVTQLNFAQNWVRDWSTNLQRGRTYYYKLLSTFPSAPIAWTAATRIDIPTAIPLTGLTATSPGPGRVRLSWAPLSSATEFSMLRGKGSDALEWIKDGAYPMKLPGTSTGYDDSGLWNGATYRYTVCALIANGSACSSVSVTLAP